VLQCRKRKGIKHDLFCNFDSAVSGAEFCQQAVQPADIDDGRRRILSAKWHMHVERGTGVGGAYLTGIPSFIQEIKDEN